MVSQLEESRMRVNGALLLQYIGQQVVLAGTVAQIDASGSSLMLKASDGKMVKVVLQSPLQENLEGVIEVHGICEGDQVACENYVTFPQTADFDMESYDEAVKIIHTVKGNPWKNYEAM